MRAAAEVVVLADDVGLVVGVVRVSDVDVGADVVATGVVLTDVLPLGVVVMTTDEPTAEEPVDTAETGAEATTTTDAAAELAVNGTAVSVVGPAWVDVHELSSTALIDSPTSRPVRRLFIISDPPLSSP